MKHLFSHNFWKKDNQKFDCKIKIDKIIHENGLSLAKKGKLKNIKLLEFITQDDYYHNKIYANKKKLSSS